MRVVRGSALPKVIVGVLVLAVLAGGAWWYLNRQNPATPGTLPSATAPAVPAVEAPAAAVSPAVEELTIDQLYREARKAMSEQRMVAPASNNALDFYLAILEKEPTNSGANDALRELFPFASGTAEQEINQGNLAEADRIIGSLAKADPSNYTLTILRSKLEAKKKQIVLQEAQVAAAAAAAATPATATPATESVTATTASATPAPSETAAVTTAPPPPTAVAPTPAPAPPPVAPSGETRDVEVVTPVAPSYPVQAARDRKEGWVEVEFTVTADGSVQDAKVTASNPVRVFDREAIRTIERTKFNPRLENGVPVSTTVRRRIEFTLGG
jgi:protein TonB